MKSPAGKAMVVSSCEPPENVFSIPIPNNEMRDSDPARVLDRFVRFGWSGVTAATGEIHFAKPSNDRFELEGTGRTIGLVRALWKLDVTQRAVANSQTMTPIETRQSESYRSKKIVTHLTFTNNGVTRARTEGEGNNEEKKTKQFVFPNLFDLNSSVTLY